MSDIFEEAEEGLRTEKWTQIAKKSAPWVGGGLVVALLIALGVWGFTHMKSNEAAEASEGYAAGLEALQSGDKAKAAQSFDAVVKNGSDAYESMALTQLAAISLSDDKPADALAKLDQAAAATGDPLLKDLASLKAAYIALDQRTAFADMEKRLTPLTKDGRPYQALAKEALAMAKLQNGDLKGRAAILKLWRLRSARRTALRSAPSRRCRLSIRARLIWRAKSLPCRNRPTSSLTNR